MGATLSLCCDGCCKYGCCCEEKVHLESASNLSTLIEDSKAWKTGDILLERYSGAEWRAVQSITDSEWTHVGVIYVNDEEDGRVQFIEVTLRGVSNYEIGEHAKWFLAQNSNHYCGYRKLSQPLTDEQIQKFKEGFELLKNKQYGGKASMAGAACDCGDCCGGCFVSLCSDKGNEKARLEKLFCSELCAELLQRAGVMKDTTESDEYTPGDFDKDRYTKWIQEPFTYGDIVYYKGTD